MYYIVYGSHCRKPVVNRVSGSCTQMPLRRPVDEIERRTHVESGATITRIHAHARTHVAKKINGLLFVKRTAVLCARGKLLE